MPDPNNQTNPNHESANHRTPIVTAQGWTPREIEALSAEVKP